MDRNVDHDEQLVEALYEQHRRALMRYVLRLTNGDQQHAEDIVQETLFRAWQHADSLHPERALRWLYTVARNLAISTHHRGARSHVVEVQLERGETAVVDDELDRVLVSWQVREALRDLTANHYAVIVELFYKRRSITEAAAVLGVPPGTVKSRSHYALRALRDVLMERGVIGP